MSFSPVVIIPFYNHPLSIEAMIHRVLETQLPCLVVDDGSDAASASVVTELAARHAPRVRLLRLATNQGKGAAVDAGLRLAHRLGHTHAIQIDADGQHDTADLPRFVQAARRHPQAMVCGQPVYDTSVPKSRLYGRYVTHVWVWINTLSLEIRDSMCGFRVYPIESTLAVLNRAHVGKRMEFDTEILVRLHWRGVRMLTLPTRVTYPSDGVSHFNVWKDNVLISGMHARLFLGMLWRSPRLLGRKLLSKGMYA